MYTVMNERLILMKKIRFIGLILSILILNSCNSGTGNKSTTQTDLSGDSETAEISFTEYEHDFGKVTEGEKVAYVFTFTNKGPGHLVINSASTSCGCTVTKYSRNPIAPGAGGTLEVVFDTSARSGVQTKTVSVNSNSKVAVVILKITADVISKQ